MYNNPIVTLPFLISSNVSKLNVEKVVKPPKKPTVRNNLNACGIMSDLFSTMPNTYPIKKQPIKLTLYVPKIGSENKFRHIMVIVYLNTAPIPPPMNIERMFVIMTTIYQK